MKIKYKIILQYDGADYFGWQRQTSTKQTIQTQLENSLEQVFKTPIYTVGSGRTDAKVHSLDHHVVFEAPFEIESKALIRAVNTNLDQSIRCIDALKLEKDLMPTSDAHSRTYMYLFSVGDNFKPFQRRYMTHIKYELDIVKMSQAAQIFMGEHDFRSFMSTGSDPATTIRTITSVSLEKSDESLHGLIPAHFIFKISGNGFLKQMVRHIFGCLVEVGRGKLTAQEIENALAIADGKHIAPCAPPEGLFKLKVEY